MLTRIPWDEAKHPRRKGKFASKYGVQLPGGGHVSPVSIAKFAMAKKLATRHGFILSKIHGIASGGDAIENWRAKLRGATGFTQLFPTQSRKQMRATLIASKRLNRMLK